MPVVCSASVYFVAVFAVAFMLGVARTLIVAPAIGETAAVLIEIPLVLAASWVVARRLVGVLRGQSIGQWAQALATPPGLMGLAGQIGFAAMPVLAGRGR